MLYFLYFSTFFDLAIYYLDQSINFQETKSIQNAPSCNVLAQQLNAFLSTQIILFCQEPLKTFDSFLHQLNSQIRIHHGYCSSFKRHV